ncbi:hypothetical protein [Massilia niastensis]|uniref:hypothetical protein n=1 Tax=Massilia niastensis TaxID=544911 RepID=UPI00035F95E7|nr:hypothetical protein [Massilia niastensis]
MAIVKYLVGTCILLLAAAGAGSILAESHPGQAGPLAQATGGYPPTVDMSRFQQAFPN